MNDSMLSSRLIENAVAEISRLPGIGRKTALRLALHLLRQDPSETEKLCESLIHFRREICFCSLCHNLSDTPVCSICADPHRDRAMICVVESVKEVMSLENTRQYNGLYHVLGGIISPMDGIGPDNLTLDDLEKKVAEQKPEEIILALSATMEGDTTNFYIYRRLKDYRVRITTLARGVAIGDELEYADRITLGRSLMNRQPFVMES